jgi:hypothetical protein
MIHICPKHGEMKLYKITQGNDKVLGYLWMCQFEDCDETVEATQEEIDNYME